MGNIWLSSGEIFGKSRWQDVELSSVKYPSSIMFSISSDALFVVTVNLWIGLGSCCDIGVVEWSCIGLREGQTSLGINTKIPNYTLNITFWPKIELWTCQTSQKTEQFANIKLFVPRLVWSHNNRTGLRTLPNITKNWTVREHQTVHSNTNVTGVATTAVKC